MKQALLTMLELQDAMNSKVNADWRQQGNEWYRAIWVECAELMDHYGWKWWKKQEPDTEQVILELIDIWHFGLSICLLEQNDIESIAIKLEQELIIQAKDVDFRVAVEEFAGQTLASKSFDVAGFASLMAYVDLSFDDLYKSYVGKNVLNFFRQDNGYKEGTYKKTWGGREDNEHLVEVLESLDASQSNFKDAVYSALANRYPNA